MLLWFLKWGLSYYVELYLWQQLCNNNDYISSCIKFYILDISPLTICFGCKLQEATNKGSISPIYHKVMETNKFLFSDEPKCLVSYSSYFASLWARQSLNMGYFSCIHSALSDQIWIKFYRRLFEHWETICDLCQM